MTPAAAASAARGRWYRAVVAASNETDPKVAHELALDQINAWDAFQTACARAFPNANCPHPECETIPGVIERPTPPGARHV